MLQEPLKECKTRISVNRQMPPGTHTHIHTHTRVSIKERVRVGEVKRREGMKTEAEPCSFECLKREYKLLGADQRQIP
jgi:hypothetical protein